MLLLLILLAAVAVAAWVWLRRPQSAVVRTPDGLVAGTDLGPWTFVASYPGIAYTARQHEARKASGRGSDAYAVQFWKVEKGKVLEEYVLDPSDSGKLLPQFESEVAPHVREPRLGQPATLAWVWNMPARRVELWTAGRPVPRGQPLTACFGSGYNRAYQTSCTTSEPLRHVIAAPGARPRPWAEVYGA